MVSGLFGVGVAGEGERGGFEVDLEGFVGDVRRGDCEEDVVLFGL